MRIPSDIHTCIQTQTPHIYTKHTDTQAHVYTDTYIPHTDTHHIHADTHTYTYTHTSTHTQTHTTHALKKLVLLLHTSNEQPKRRLIKQFNLQ